jgi:c-di-GMP-binding flagellar brake protein YcgR
MRNTISAWGEEAMKIETAMKAHDKANLLHLEFGGRLLVTIDGMERNLWSTLIGVEPDSCLIIRTPKIEHIDKTLVRGNHIGISYFFAGTVYGFQSTILDHINSPSSLIFISYPHEIRRIELRENPRVDCCIPGYLSAGNMQYNGMILDLSAKGCRFSMLQSDQPSFPSSDIGDSLTVRFIIPGSESIRTLKGRVKNIVRDAKKMNMGVEFVHLEAEILHEIEAYIRGIVDFAAPFPK